METQRNLKMIPHSVKSRSPVGTIIFVVLCCLDPLLQYAVLAPGLWGPFLDLLNVSSSAPDVSLGLSTKYLILLAMTLGSIIEKIYTILYTANEIMPISSAAIISAPHTVFTSANSIISLTTAALLFTPGVLSSYTKYGISPVFMIRTVGYIIRLSGEIISETQHKKFKDDPKNTEKLYAVSLF
jgi:hypothetical protein